MKPTQTLNILGGLIHVVFMIQIEYFDVWNKGEKTPKKIVKSLHKRILYENPYKSQIFY